MDVEEGMRALAERGHAGQLRKDGRTPYVEHPRAVVAQLHAWGVADGETLAVAWGHDLLEDTAVTEEEILEAAGPRHGAEVLSGIRTITRDRAAWPVKRDWLQFLAGTAGDRELVVKCADRICNTRDFVPLAGVARARSYLADGAAVFAAARRTAFAASIAATLDVLRTELGAGSPPASETNDIQTKDHDNEQTNP